MHGFRDFPVFSIFPLDNPTVSVYYADRTVTQSFSRKVPIVFLEIDPSLSQPLFEQIALQIKFAIAAGTIRVNEMVPSVRELSRQLAINPNTVARAYRLLQDEEILIPRRGVGLIVAEHSQTACQQQRKDFFRQRFNAFLKEVDRSRLSAEELSEIIRR